MSAYDHLTPAQLLELLPAVMANDLREHLDDEAFIRETATIYLDADELGRADILAFHGADPGRMAGPEMSRQSAAKHQHDIPTADELRRAVEGDA